MATKMPSSGVCSADTTTTTLCLCLLLVLAHVTGSDARATNLHCAPACRCYHLDGLRAANCTSLSNISNIAQSLDVLRVHEFDDHFTVKEDVLSSLVNLKELYLSHLGLHKLYPGAFRGLHQLEVLDLSHNRFAVPSEVAKAVNELPNLHRLLLRGNPLGKFPLLISKQLSFLDVGSSRIRDISDNVLRNLVGLKHLKLNDNQLTVIKPKWFPHSVVSLDLSNNSIKHFTRSEFQKLDNLEHVEISGNPIHCSCETLKIRYDFIMNNLVLCAYPKEYYGVDLFALKKKQICLKDNRVKREVDDYDDDKTVGEETELDDETVKTLANEPVESGDGLTHVSEHAQEQTEGDISGDDGELPATVEHVSETPSNEDDKEQSDKSPVSEDDKEEAEEHDNVASHASEGESEHKEEETDIKEEEVIGENKQEKVVDVIDGHKEEHVVGESEAVLEEENDGKNEDVGDGESINVLEGDSVGSAEQDDTETSLGTEGEKEETAHVLDDTATQDEHASVLDNDDMEQEVHNSPLNENVAKDGTINEVDDNVSLIASHDKEPDSMDDNDGEGGEKKEVEGGNNSQDRVDDMEEEAVLELDNISAHKEEAELSHELEGASLHHEDEHKDVDHSPVNEEVKELEELPKEDQESAATGNILDPFGEIEDHSKVVENQEDDTEHGVEEGHSKVVENQEGDTVHGVEENHSKVVENQEEDPEEGVEEDHSKVVENQEEDPVDVVEEDHSKVVANQEEDKVDGVEEDHSKVENQEEDTVHGVEGGHSKVVENHEVDTVHGVVEAHSKVVENQEDTGEGVEEGHSNVDENHEVDTVHGVVEAHSKVVENQEDTGEGVEGDHSNVDENHEGDTVHGVVEAHSKVVVNQEDTGEGVEEGHSEAVENQEEDTPDGVEESHSIVVENQEDDTVHGVVEAHSKVVENQEEDKVHGVEEDHSKIVENQEEDRVDGVEEGHSKAAENKEEDTAEGVHSELEAAAEDDSNETNEQQHNTPEDVSSELDGGENDEKTSQENSDTSSRLMIFDDEDDDDFDHDSNIDPEVNELLKISNDTLPPSDDNQDDEHPASVVHSIVHAEHPESHSDDKNETTSALDAAERTEEDKDVKDLLNWSEGNEEDDDGGDESLSDDETKNEQEFHFVPEEASTESPLEGGDIFSHLESAEGPSDSDASVLETLEESNVTHSAGEGHDVVSGTDLLDSYEDEDEHPHNGNESIGTTTPSAEDSASEEATVEPPKLVDDLSEELEDVSGKHDYSFEKMEGSGSDEDFIPVFNAGSGFEDPINNESSTEEPSDEGSGEGYFGPHTVFRIPKLRVENTSETSTAGPGLDNSLELSLEEETSAHDETPIFPPSQTHETTERPPAVEEDVVFRVNVHDVEAAKPPPQVETTTARLPQLEVETSTMLGQDEVEVQSSGNETHGDIKQGSEAAQDSGNSSAGSYVVLGIIMCIIVILLAYAVIRSHQKKKKRSPKKDVENPGRELQDVSKPLIDSKPPTTIEPPVDETREPLMTKEKEAALNNSEPSEVLNNGDVVVETDAPAHNNKDANGVSSTKKTEPNGTLAPPLVNGNGTAAPVSPVSGRVKVVAKELPDSVAKRPILIVNRGTDPTV